MNGSCNQRHVIIFLGVICILTLMATGLRTGLASNNEQAPGGLFIDAEGVENHLYTGDVVDLRTRYVKIDFDLLGSIGEDEVLLFNLFDDINYNIIIEDKEEYPAGGSSWVGYPEGIPFGSLVLVQQGGQIAGNISMPGTTYQIRYAGEGVHVIKQVDQSKYLPEAEPVRVEIPTGEIADAAVQPETEDGSVIDVMVVYTPAALQEVLNETNMNNLINLAVLETNASYENSGINQRLNLVHSQVISYTESASMNTDLTRLSGTSDDYLKEVHSLRNTHHADLVSLFRKHAGAEACGIAHLMDTVSIAYANLGFSVVDWDCATGYFSFGHELGHNMGAAHDWYADDSKDLPFSHNKGYVNLSDSWRTIMAYNEECDCSDEVEPCPAPGLRTTPGLPLCTRLQYWSNPDVKYNDDPMGVPVGSSTACVKGDLVHPDCDADVRDVLNKTANTVANFRHPERLNIAVTPFQYDHVGGLLEELNYSWTQVLDTDLNTYEKISHYDIIFANSSLAGLVNGPDAAEAIKKFVKNGGSFYASDFAYTYVSSAFPDHLRVFDPPHLGSQEVVTVDIVDAGLASYLNPSNPPGTIDLTYTQDGWVPIENVSEDADVHFQVEIPVSETETEIIPLAASFMPYKNSAGRVTYTSFNNYPQIKDMEKKLVKYLLLTTYASKIAEEAEQVITSADGTLSQTSLNTINKDGKSDKTAYNVDEISDLAFVLHWPGSALKFKVFQPNGDLFSQDETNSPPITIFVPAAQSGEWAYQVEGVDVPFENYPHAVSVGYQNLYSSHIYLPTILDK